MDIDGLPPVSNSASLITPIVKWAGRVVAPLGTSMISKEGITEIAGRINGILGLAILAIIAIAIRYSSTILQSLRPNIAVVSSSPQTIESSEKDAGEWGQQTTQPSIPAAVAQSSSAVTPASSAADPLSPLTRPTIEILRDTIDGDVEKIHQEFEQCLKNLQGCKPGSQQFQDLIVDFKRKTAHFHKVYGPYEKAFAPTYFLAVKNYEVILTDLNDILRGIIRVKGDGNCLFHSFVKAFERLRPYLEHAQVWNEQLLNHQVLRRAVNEFMQTNFESDEDLKRLIDDAIIAHVEAKKTDLPLQKDSEQYKLLSAEELKAEGFEIDEAAVRLRLKNLDEEESSLVDFEGPKKYQLYFNKFKEPGFFAAFAAAYAMCKILKEKIGIRVAVEPERQIVTEYDAFNVKAPILITLIFKGDHFDVKFPEGFLN